MEIAILGWGSLVWEPGTLKGHIHDGVFYKGGPKLPIEFSRISQDRRLTPVIDEQHGTEVPTRVATSKRSDLGEVVTDLWIREMGFTGPWSIAHERSKDGRIGYADRSGKNTSINLAKDRLSPDVQDHQYAYDLLFPWLLTSGFDAVVWSALPPNFKEIKGRDFSTAGAVSYLNNFPKKALPNKVSCQEAFDDIQKAPAEVQTPVRIMLTDQSHAPNKQQSWYRSPETLTSFHNRERFHYPIRIVGGILFSLAAFLSIWGFSPGKFAFLQWSPQQWLHDTSWQGLITIYWALIPPIVFWLEYYVFAPYLAKISENMRQDDKDEAEIGKAIDILKHKLGQLNDFRGVSVPIWAGVLLVLNALYTNNVKILEGNKTQTVQQTSAAHHATP